MTLLRTLVAMAALLTSSMAFADTDCTDPIDQSTPRELLRQQVEQRGWTVQRIKVDDDCYEARGIDRMGNKVKVRFAPASLRMRSIEVAFGPAGDAPDHVGTGHAKFHRGEAGSPASEGNQP